MFSSLVKEYRKGCVVLVSHRFRLLHGGWHSSGCFLVPWFIYFSQSSKAQLILSVLYVPVGRSVQCVASHERLIILHRLNTNPQFWKATKAEAAAPFRSLGPSSLLGAQCSCAFVQEGSGGSGGLTGVLWRGLGRAGRPRPHARPRTHGSCVRLPPRPSRASLSQHESSRHAACLSVLSPSQPWPE